MTSRLALIPISLAGANAVVARLHRHHKPVVGHKFTLAVFITNRALNNCRSCAAAGQPICSGLMADEASPTLQEIENARIRQEIADRQAEEYAEVERLALEALGPGWTPWMKLSLLDSDYHQGGDSKAVATAYKVYWGEERLSENAVYVRRLPDGEVRSAESYEPLFGELLREPHPTRTIEVQGKHVPSPRYSLCWSALELYEPRSAEQLAAARVKREQRAIKNEAQENPLFAEQILKGKWRPEKTRRGRSL